MPKDGGKFRGAMMITGPDSDVIRLFGELLKVAMSSKALSTSLTASVLLSKALSHELSQVVEDSPERVLQVHQHAAADYTVEQVERQPDLEAELDRTGASVAGRLLMGDEEVPIIRKDPKKN